MKRKAVNQRPLGKIVADAMKEKGMTQAELASIIKYSTPVVSDLLNGKRSFSPKQIVRIAILLGLDAIEMGRMQSDYEIMQVINPLFEKSEETEQS